MVEGCRTMKEVKLKAKLRTVSKKAELKPNSKIEEKSDTHRLSLGGGPLESIHATIFPVRR